MEYQKNCNRCSQKGNSNTLTIDCYSINENLEVAKQKVEWDKQMEKGERVSTNAHILSIVKDLQQMYKVLHNILPKQSLEQIYSEVFRFLAKSLDEFFLNLNIMTKYGKKRVKVDLKYLQKNLQNMKFSNEDMVNMVTQKINTILTAKCGINESET